MSQLQDFILILSGLLVPFTRNIAWLMTLVFSAALGGIVFKGQKGWLKTLFSGGLFVKPKEGFVFFLLELVLLGGLGPYAQDFIESLLAKHANLLFPIAVEFVALAYIWFRHAYGFRTSQIALLVAVLNPLLVVISA